MKKSKTRPGVTLVYSTTGLRSCYAVWRGVELQDGIYHIASQDEQTLA